MEDKQMIKRANYFLIGILLAFMLTMCQGCMVTFPFLERNYVQEEYKVETVHEQWLSDNVTGLAGKGNIVIIEW